MGKCHQLSTHNQYRFGEHDVPMELMEPKKGSGEQLNSKVLSLEDWFATLQSGPAGLTAEEARRRLAVEGANTLGKEKHDSILLLLAAQFNSSVIYLLLVAALISAAMQDYLQTAGIAAAIVINAAVGFLTEYQAKVSLKNLSKLSGATARVKRNGGEVNLDVSEIVRGDIVILDAGASVPADLELIESASLNVDESVLTGESVSVPKQRISAGDEQDSAARLFQGTTVTSGRALALVTHTGRNTRLGKLGVLLNQLASGKTPLERQLEQLGRQLTWLTVILSALLIPLGLAKGQQLHVMLETGIALAVAAIPEGLPVVATLALAIGIQRMVKVRAILRKMSAVETLGRTTVICTDKTGTLTQNRMMLTNIVLPLGSFVATGNGYDPSEGTFEYEQAAHRAVDVDEIMDILKASILCNDATLEFESAEGWHIHGDPTEGALLTAAAKAGLDWQLIRTNHNRVAEVPFDLLRKRMSTLHANSDGSMFLCTKGSPESMLEISSFIRKDGVDYALTDSDKAWFKQSNQKLADAGLRVLAVAWRSIDEKTVCIDETMERNMVLLGLVGMSDRPKPNVAEAIEMCQQAGIKILMITGDQPATAKALANELHISEVLARVTPEMKLDIVKKLQMQGETVAMTGDGVNDAPALRQADIGVAMGAAGTDLAKEASALVITDDNFATIVKAIQEGRKIYANIKRAVAYLLTASVAAVLVIAVGLLAFEQLWLEPLQLLWLNLIMHVFPSLGIVLQKAAPGIMREKPRQANEQLIGKTERLQILWRSICVCVAAVATVQVCGQESVSSVVLASLSLSLLLQAWSWLIWQTNAKPTAFLNNRPMLINTGIGLILLVLPATVPAIQLILHTVSLPAEVYLRILLISAASFVFTLSARNKLLS
jgi:P-type Ca2+ transporter type 2C